MSPTCSTNTMSRKSPRSYEMRQAAKQFARAVLIPAPGGNRSLPRLGVYWSGYAINRSPDQRIQRWFQTTDDLRWPPCETIVSVPTSAGQASILVEPKL